MTIFNYYRNFLYEALAKMKIIITIVLHKIMLISE